MTKRNRQQSRPDWTGLCSVCGRPLAETSHEETRTGVRLTFVCAAARGNRAMAPCPSPALERGGDAYHSLDMGGRA